MLAYNIGGITDYYIRYTEGLSHRDPSVCTYNIVLCMHSDRMTADSIRCLPVIHENPGIQVGHAGVWMIAVWERCLNIGPLLDHRHLHMG